jgi:hypothetical protein
MPKRAAFFFMYLTAALMSRIGPETVRAADGLYCATAITIPSPCKLRELHNVHEQHLLHQAEPGIYTKNGSAAPQDLLPQNRYHFRASAAENCKRELHPFVFRIDDAAMQVQVLTGSY